MAKILIVDDNPDNIALAEMVLRYAGYQTLSATGGAAGVALARRELPDLILMDLLMPGMDGAEATQLLKQDAATAAIPVIGMTALTMQDDAEQILAAGFDAYLSKPYDIPQLTASIECLLGNAVPGV